MFRSKNPRESTMSREKLSALFILLMFATGYVMTCSPDPTDPPESDHEHRGPSTPTVVDTNTTS